MTPPSLDAATALGTSAAAGAAGFWAILKTWAHYNPTAQHARQKSKEQVAKIISLEARVTSLEAHIAKLESNRDFLVRAGRKAYLAFSTQQSERGMAFLEMFEDEHK